MAKHTTKHEDATLSSSIADQMAAAEVSADLASPEVTVTEPKGQPLDEIGAPSMATGVTHDEPETAKYPAEIQALLDNGTLTEEDIESMDIQKADVPEGRAARESAYAWDKVPVGYSFFIDKTTTGGTPKVATFYTLTSNRNERGLAQFKAKADTNKAGKKGVRIYRLEDLTPEEHAEKYPDGPFAKRAVKAS